MSDWDLRVLELTDGRGVDHVVAVVGGEDLNRAVNAVPIGGTLSIVGLLAGARGAVDVFAIALRPVIDRVLRFDEVGAALRHLDSGTHFGKVCIRL